MPDPKHSKRFKPGAVMDKVIPAVLILLVLGLAAVIVLVILSLIDAIPS